MYVCMYWYNNISEQNRCQFTTELDLEVDHELGVMIVGPNNMLDLTILQGYTVIIIVIIIGQLVTQASTLTLSLVFLLGAVRSFNCYQFLS